MHIHSRHFSIVVDNNLPLVILRACKNDKGKYLCHFFHKSSVEDDARAKWKPEIDLTKLSPTELANYKITRRKRWKSSVLDPTVVI